MFPLNAGNEPGKKALAYFDEMCKKHGVERAKEMLDREFPWIDEVREVARANNNQHPDHAKAQEFLRGLNHLRRAHERFEDEVQKEEEAIKESYSESPGPTALIESWFAERDLLQASFEELAHFTGFSPGSFGYAIRKLEQNGFRFVRNGSGLRVAERPAVKEEMIDEAISIMEKLPQVDLEWALEVLNTHFGENTKSGV